VNQSDLSFVIHYFYIAATHIYPAVSRLRAASVTESRTEPLLATESVSTAMKSERRCVRFTVICTKPCSSDLTSDHDGGGWHRLCAHGNDPATQVVTSFTGFMNDRNCALRATNQSNLSELSPARAKERSIFVLDFTGARARGLQFVKQTCSNS
jgi:hypothetical protein